MLYILVNYRHTIGFIDELMSTKHTKTTVKLLDIDGESAGQRIDNFLMACLKPIPRSLVYRLLRTGQVRVNKGRVKPAYRLVEQDQVRIPPLSYQEKTDTGAISEDIGLQLQGIVLYEDEHVMVVDKPAGLAVHAGSGTPFGLIEALRQQNPQYPSLELVHRLDRETSGCLLLAKHRHVLRDLHAMMRNQEINKVYTALLFGRLAMDEHRIIKSLAFNRLQGDERMVVVDPAGKSAETYIYLTRRYADASLVKIQIPTGRKHQIRVHAASIGHPVAGDPKYGNKPFNRSMREYGLKRVFLHATRLSFTLGQKITVTAPLPNLLQQVLNRLAGEGLDGN